MEEMKEHFLVSVINTVITIYFFGCAVKYQQKLMVQGYSNNQDLCQNIDIHEVYQNTNNQVSENTNIQEVRQNTYIQVVPQNADIQEVCQDTDIQEVPPEHRLYTKPTVF
jgi:hypothetical protein